MSDKVSIAGSTSGNYIQLTHSVLEVYTQQALVTALPLMLFNGVAVKRTDLQTAPGRTLNIPKYNPLAGGGALDEKVVMTTQAMGKTVLPITVTEHGNAVQLTEMLLWASFDDEMSNAAMLLGRNYASVYDSYLRDTLLASSNVVYSQAGGAAVSRAGLTAGSVMNVNLVRTINETLATRKAPRFAGQNYIGFVHPHQATALRADSAWVNAHLYASPENILKGEIGRIEGVRFFETTQVPYVKKGTQQIWADGVDTGTTTVIAANDATDVYRAVFVGEWGLGVAEGLPVELRDGGVKDHGRFRTLAWYGIYGAAILESNHVLIAETA